LAIQTKLSSSPAKTSGHFSLTRSNQTHMDMQEKIQLREVIRLVIAAAIRLWERSPGVAVIQLV
jgi:hypothetical protein